MNTEQQDLEDALQIIKKYIDTAILNNATAPTANKSTFVELRLFNRVSIARIAVLLNITAQDVGDLESSKQKLTVAQALTLGQFYGVSADSLI